MEIVKYANTSGFYGGAWKPEITGYDQDDSEYPFDLDLYEGARYNWDAFKRQYPEAKGQREFFAEFRDAVRETKEMAARTR